jgi:hypothetical protein
MIMSNYLRLAPLCIHGMEASYTRMGMNHLTVVPENVRPERQRAEPAAERPACGH